MYYHLARYKLFITLVNLLVVFGNWENIRELAFIWLSSKLRNLQLHSYAGPKSLLFWRGQLWTMVHEMDRPFCDPSTWGMRAGDQSELHSETCFLPHPPTLNYWRVTVVRGNRRSKAGSNAEELNWITLPHTDLSRVTENGQHQSMCLSHLSILGPNNSSQKEARDHFPNRQHWPVLWCLPRTFLTDPCFLLFNVRGKRRGKGPRVVDMHAIPSFFGRQDLAT